MGGGIAEGLEDIRFEDRGSLGPDFAFAGVVFQKGVKVVDLLEEEGFEDIVAKDVGLLLKAGEALATLPCDEFGEIAHLEAILRENAPGEGEFIGDLLPKCLAGLGLGPTHDKVDVKEGGHGFGKGFIEENGVVGADGLFAFALLMLVVHAELVVEVKGVNQLVNEDFASLFPAKEDDHAILVGVLVGGFQEGDATVDLVGSQSGLCLCLCPEGFAKGGRVVVDDLTPPFTMEEFLKKENDAKEIGALAKEGGREPGGAPGADVEDGLGPGP